MYLSSCVMCTNLPRLMEDISAIHIFLILRKSEQKNYAENKLK